MDANTKLLASAILAAMIGTSANATPVLHTDTSSFNAALGVSLTTESFESFSDTASPLSLGPVTITTADAIDSSKSKKTDGKKSIRISPKTDEYIKFTFDDPIFGFAIDIIDALDKHNSSIMVSIDGALPIAAFSGLFLNNNVQFLGITDDMFGFTMVQIFATDLADTVYYDRLRYDGQIPEPGTLAVLVLGLAGIGLMRRRRKA